MEPSRFSFNEPVRTYTGKTGIVIDTTGHAGVLARLDPFRLDDSTLVRNQEVFYDPEQLILLSAEPDNTPDDAPGGDCPSHGPYSDEDCPKD